jgi:hypothetical protein
MVNNESGSQGRRVVIDDQSDAVLGAEMPCQAWPRSCPFPALVQVPPDVRICRKWVPLRGRPPRAKVGKCDDAARDLVTSLPRSQHAVSLCELILRWDSRFMKSSRPSSTARHVLVTLRLCQSTNAAFFRYNVIKCPPQSGPLESYGAGFFLTGGASGSS